MSSPKPPKPNYTQIPNDLLGNITAGNRAMPGFMATLTESQLKVYLAICRITFGYHREERRLSLSQMVTITGLVKQSVIDAAYFLEGFGLIERVRDGGVTLWRVIVNDIEEADQSNIQTELVQNLDQSSPKFRPPSKKETKKETRKIPFGPIATKLMLICSLDENRLTTRQELQLKESLNILVNKINVSIEQLEQFSKFWSASWRTGPPTLLQVPETWGEFEHWLGGSNGKALTGEIIRTPDGGYQI